MKFTILFIFILECVLGQSKLTGEKPKLLVLPSDKGKSEKSIESTITDLVSSEAVKLNRFIIIDRNQMEQIVREQKLQMGGVIRDEEIINFGELASAKEALVVSVLTKGSSPLGLVKNAVSGPKIPIVMIAMNKSQANPRVLSPSVVNFVFERFFNAANSSPRGRECSRVRTASYSFSLSRTLIS